MDQCRWLNTSEGHRAFPMAPWAVSNSSVNSSYFLPSMHWPKPAKQINELFSSGFLDFSITKQNKSISFDFQQSLKLVQECKHMQSVNKNLSDPQPPSDNADHHRPA